MIAYDLQCSRGHRFEGWFDDAPAFDAQRAEGLIGCPLCGDTLVARVPSTFAIRSAPAVEKEPRQQALGRIVRQLTEYVQAHFEDVGCDFAREALKIHYGATEARNIRGISTQEEENTLRREGVEFIKLPLPKPLEPET